MRKILKQHQLQKRIDEERNTYYKTTGPMLGRLGIGGLLTTSALTTTTAAFDDSNAIGIVERIFAALMGQPV